MSSSQFYLWWNKKKILHDVFFNLVTNIKYFNERTKIKALEYICSCIQVDGVVWGFPCWCFLFTRTTLQEDSPCHSGKCFHHFLPRRQDHPQPLWSHKSSTYMTLLHSKFYCNKHGHRICARSEECWAILWYNLHDLHRSDLKLVATSSLLL